MTSAIIYTRFSPRPNAKECDSCEKQQERCRIYCGQKGYEVRQCFHDENISGGDLNRPGLSFAIRCLLPGDILVVDSSNRLARDMLVNLTIRHQVEEAGATIEFADGTPPATTPEGWLFQNILAAFAAYERDRIKLNTKRGIARNRALGKKINGRIPTGMKEDPENPGMLVKCDRERNAILQVCRWKSLHQSMTTHEMAITLDVQPGIWLYRGSPWSPRLIRKIIAKHSFWADPVDGEPEKEPEFF